ncbi:MAG: hypothetical protein ACFFDY_00390 [Candidatus Thorarchaeota archaeon]
MNDNDKPTNQIEESSPSDIKKPFDPSQMEETIKYGYIDIIVK